LIGQTWAWVSLYAFNQNHDPLEYISQAPPCRPLPAGAFTVNLATGAAAETALFSRADKMNIHGALMSVAWVLLLPLGMLAAKHRRV
jgi:hypothetical protein